MADEGEVGFIPLDSFDLFYPFNGFGVEDIATYSIEGIGGIDDYTAVAQAFHYLPDMFGVRVFGVDTN